jgi:hypothetical protein
MVVSTVTYVVWSWGLMPRDVPSTTARRQPVGDGYFSHAGWAPVIHTHDTGICVLDKFSIPLNGPQGWGAGSRLVLKPWPWDHVHGIFFHAIFARFYI